MPKKTAEKGRGEGGGMSNYLRNVAVLRRIQIARDNSVPDDYWHDAPDDEGEEDDD